jgi:hypothetical protein
MVIQHLSSRPKKPTLSYNRIDTIIKRSQHPANIAFDHILANYRLCFLERRQDGPRSVFPEFQYAWLISGVLLYNSFTRPAQRSIRASLIARAFHSPHYQS